MAAMSKRDVAMVLDSLQHRLIRRRMCSHDRSSSIGIDRSKCCTSGSFVKELTFPAMPALLQSSVQNSRASTARVW